MITQTAACYRHHSIKQALRRLLPLPSRGGGDAAMA